MKPTERKIKGILVTIECIILGIGVILSFSGTSGATQYSNDYAIYYLYALLGIVFIVVLLVLRKRQYTIYLGLLLICIYLFLAGGQGYVTCVTAERRFRIQEQHEDEKVYLPFDDEVYAYEHR